MTDKTKIGFVSHASDLYGAPRSLLLLLEQLNRERYNPFVICPSQGPLVNKIEKLGIRVFIVSRGTPANQTFAISVLRKVLQRVKCIVKFIEILYREQPDVVYINTIAHASPVVAAWLCRLPVIIHVREAHSYFVGFRRKIRSIPIIHFPKRFIAVSQAIKKVLMDQGVPQSKISVVYNGVDSEEFKMRINEREACRRDLGLNNSDILVGTVGQISRRKGILYFVGAANIVNKKMGDDVKFIIIGGSPDPEYLAMIENAIKKYGLTSHFILTGFKENVRRYLATIDIFVNPTLEEPFARVNLEAMAIGKPVIATDVGGNREAIVDGETGYLVPPCDPGKLAEKIIALAGSEALRQRFGYLARKRVEKNFSSDKYAKSIEAILQEILDQNCRKGGAGKESSG